MKTDNSEVKKIIEELNYFYKVLIVVAVILGLLSIFLIIGAVNHSQNYQTMQYKSDNVTYSLDFASTYSVQGYSNTSSIVGNNLSKTNTLVVYIFGTNKKMNCNLLNKQNKVVFTTKINGISVPTCSIHNHASLETDVEYNRAWYQINISSYDNVSSVDQASAQKILQSFKVE